MTAKILTYIAPLNSNSQFAMPHLQLKRDIQRKTGTCANQKIREVLHTSDYTPKTPLPISGMEK